MIEIEIDVMEEVMCSWRLKFAYGRRCSFQVEMISGPHMASLLHGRMVQLTWSMLQRKLA
jgi:hypothetical protein